MAFPPQLTSTQNTEAAGFLSNVGTHVPDTHHILEDCNQLPECTALKNLSGTMKVIHNSGSAQSAWKAVQTRINGTQTAATRVLAGKVITVTPVIIIITLNTAQAL
jgi:hypothetical protein